MPVLKPFRAIRYKDELDPALVTCPPYDVISESERGRLVSLDERNFVRLALPRETLGSYEAGAQMFRRWIADGTLRQDESESFYLYVTETESAGTTVLLAGALQLESFGEGVHPHEATMPGPKADRLEVMRHFRANLEPLWFFSSRPLPGFADMVDSVMSHEPLTRVKQGVTEHSLYRVDPGEAGGVVSALTQTPVVVADGHHRYETALAYRDLRRESDGPGLWDSTLAVIGDAEHLPPRVEAIHRIVNISVDQLRPLLTLDRLDSPPAQLGEAISLRGPGHVGVVTAEGVFIVRTAATLDTQYLVERVIRPIDAAVTYEHDLQVAVAKVSSDKTLFVMPPVPLTTVAAYAVEGKRMPPKSTLFLPKPRSGVLVRDLG